MASSKKKKKYRARARRNKGNFIFVAVVIILLLVIAGLGYRLWVKDSANRELRASMPVITPAPVVTPVPTPEPTPVPDPGKWELHNIVPEADPALVEKLSIQTRIYVEDTLLEDSTSYVAPELIAFGTGEEYTQLEGITTFRGNNYRDTAAWGTIGDDPSEMEIVWRKKIGEIDEWSGVGWTGQCAIVRWPAETIQIMNIYPEKKEKQGLTEVIYATLDGNIYFLDLDDGQPTRDVIKIGAPIKGSLTVDPRGYPLLYCGQGIDEVHGRDVEIGTRIFSLIDGKCLYFIDGHDKYTIRKWYAFDCSPLVHAETDTMLQLGENAIVYIVKLNTDYDPEAGTISIDPEMTRYVFKTDISTRPGMESSLAVYNHYVYFPDNSGYIQCLDLQTLQPKWAAYAGDDTDSTMVIEEEAPDQVAVYTACELDLRGTYGDIYIRKFDALSGEELWMQTVKCKTYGDTEGGAFATPALGKGELSHLIFFNIARTEEHGGTLFALSKETGEIVWERDLKKYGWSSPVCMYTDEGKGYIVVGNAAGYLKLLDALTGEFVCEVNVDANIEASPVIFNNMLVVGTRENRILGIEIK